MIDPSILRALVDAGATSEMIIAAIEADHAKEQSRIIDKRAKDAERQRKSRLSRAVTVTQCDNDGHDVTQCDIAPAASDSAPMRVVNTNLPSEDISLKTNTSCLQKNPVEKPKSTNRGSRLPADWMPDDAGRKLASELLGNSGARLHLEKFRDWAAAAAGAKGVKADWNAAWRNWVRRSAEDAKPRAGPPWTDPQEIRNPALRALQRLSQKNAQRLDEFDIFAAGSGPCQSAPSAGNPGDETGAEAGRFGPVFDLAAYR